MSRYVLHIGDKLNMGESLVNGNLHLTMQNDANLVLLYKNKSIWESGTKGKSDDCSLLLQSDGHLAIWDNASGKPIWRSSNHGKGNGNYVCVLQNDHNLVIYTDPIWSTGTYIPTQ